LNAAADGRPREVKDIGGAPKTAMLGHDDRVLQVAEIKREIWHEGTLWRFQLITATQHPNRQQTDAWATVNGYPQHCLPETLNVSSSG
jgi:hypothetical protein